MNLSSDSRLNDQNRPGNRKPGDGHSWVFAAIFPLAIAVGCAENEKSVVNETPSDPGYVMFLPGVEGGGWQLHWTIEGLRRAGLQQTLETRAWGARLFGSYQNLTDLPTNIKTAEVIAAELADRRKAHPDESISLLGYSGGGGLAVLVAERLPPEVVLDRLVLISAALSPDYELSKAQSHCRRGIVNFYSGGDWVILGAGTSVFGTIDRKKTRAAGHVGFQDAAGNVIQNDKLMQVAWTADWMRHGHYGGHVGWLSGPWAQNVLATFLGMPNKSRSSSS